MIYKDFQDIKLSALGFGSMRLPVKNGVYADIDADATAEMVDYAITHGVNYFDTAWGYHDGESERVMGSLLNRYPRESWYLASKFPGYDLANMDKVESIFEQQLKKCGVEYFDFYLFHNVCELNIEQYLDPKYGVYDYLIAQKKNGRIKHLGCSVHGTYDTMKRFFDAYGKDMEFCQLQLNYVDWKFQNAEAKVRLCEEYGVPVWVMEPVRGGMLASLSEQRTALLKSMRPDESVVAWAFRFLQSLPSVAVTLSGMSDFSQVKQNIEIFSEDKPLDNREMTALLDMAEKMFRKESLPCTGCRYCTSHCPMGLDIPRMIELYNEHIFTGGGFRAPMALAAMPEDKQPSACIGCRSCEAVCPQQIKISEMMSDFVEKLKA